MVGRCVDRLELLSCDGDDNASCELITVVAAGCCCGITDSSTVASLDTGCTAASDACCPEVSVDDNIISGGKLMFDTGSGSELAAADLRSASWYEVRVCTFTNNVHIHLYILRQ